MRLACVKRAASVDSEPGSNSRLNHLGHRARGSTSPICLIAPVLTQVTDEINCMVRAFARPYFTSNQIVKDLRSIPDDQRRSDWNPASKAVLSIRYLQKVAYVQELLGILKELLQRAATALPATTLTLATTHFQVAH